MTKYIVEGGRPLFGEIHISGAKNAAVAIIPAALMVSGPCRIENMPQISDVTLLLGILQDLGAKVRYVNPHTVEIDSSNLRNGRVPYESARRCRASYYMLGALLGRFGAADSPRTAGPPGPRLRRNSRMLPRSVPCCLPAGGGSTSACTSPSLPVYSSASFSPRSRVPLRHLDQHVVLRRRKPVVPLHLLLQPAEHALPV